MYYLKFIAYYLNFNIMCVDCVTKWELCENYAPPIRIYVSTKPRAPQTTIPDMPTQDTLPEITHDIPYRSNKPANFMSSIPKLNLAASKSNYYMPETLAKSIKNCHLVLPYECHHSSNMGFYNKNKPSALRYKTRHLHNKSNNNLNAVCTPLFNELIKYRRVRNISHSVQKPLLAVQNISYICSHLQLKYM